MPTFQHTRPAAAPLARRPRRQGAGGTLVGIFIGLVLGLALAAAVAYYLMGGRSAYQAQVTTNKDVRDAAREAVKSPLPDKPVEKPRFDFYKILPGGGEPKLPADKKAPERPDKALADKAAAKPSESTAKAPEKATETMAAKAPERTVEKVPATDAVKAAKGGERYWLQAGSFAQAADAENLKAQLALAGWEAGVQTGMLPDQAIRYRVRLGPYDNTDELNRVRTQLTQRGFEVAVIKY
jgi:cell division protein FtsN